MVAAFSEASLSSSRSRSAGVVSRTALRRRENGCRSGTRERFGWTPTHPTLAEDLAAGAYTA